MKKNTKPISVLKEDEKGMAIFFDIKPFDDIMKQLRDYVEYIEKKNDELKSEINRLKNVNRDEEIEKYKQMINSLEKNSVYILNEKQDEQMKNFRKAHYSRCKCSYYDIICSPTGLYTAVAIKCKSCGEELDLTDYSRI